jgi:imidazolonepropionase-like amidohydrolase
MVQAGLTPAEALQTATCNPARYLDQEKDFGTVETGKAADLVLLEENPLTDICNTRRNAAVVVGGKLLTREVLDAMLADVEAAASKE